MELFLDVLGESLVDTAKMLPFLFLAYLFIEYVEHRHGEKIEAVLERSGRWGAIPASLLGCVPQCGFSVAAGTATAVGVGSGSGSAEAGGSVAEVLPPGFLLGFGVAVGSGVGSTGFT